MNTTTIINRILSWEETLAIHLQNLESFQRDLQIMRSFCEKERDKEDAAKVDF